MLQIEKIQWRNPPTNTDTGDTLFTLDPSIVFVVKAPLYWWVDTDWIKYYLNMPLSDFDFCLDAFDTGKVRSAVEGLAKQLTDINASERKIMQLLPLSTIVRATIEISYREIVEVCENYLMGEYNYQKGYGFPNDREWADFCETLLDLQGIRDLMEEE